MKKTANFVIALLMAACTVAAWMLLNRPIEEPPWPARIQGMSFAPYRAHHDAQNKEFPTPEEIDQDLALLADKVHAVRTYTVESTLAEIPRLAAGHDLNVALGAWIGADAAANEVEIARLIEAYKANYRNVVRVLVGNEALLRTDVTVEQAIHYLDRVKKEVRAPVGLAEPWHIWLAHPELVAHVDYIAIHVLPYWEGVPVDAAVDYVAQRYEQVKNAYPGKPVILGEVGWPSLGRTRQGAEPSLANEAKFLRRFLARAEQEGWTYYVVEAFDQPWKESIERGAGPSWGVYNAWREPKFPFTQPIVRVPDWRELAAISVGIAVVLLALLFRDSGAMSARGRGFLALTVYGLAAIAVWIVYDYTRQYLTLASLSVGIVLLIAMLGLAVVLLAEAHEWAEALWITTHRRMYRPPRVREDELPMVSVHVPAYNEPPDMLIRTLDALAALDYPRYEVLVIDNNTKDPAIWEPVEAHCAKLGPRFRFFHVAPLAGFKAGALNYALERTDPRAEIVAVIDSDYLVQPRWLRDLAPAFHTPGVAIVQGPQDYRDGSENLFKALCNAEYRGFFHIGMVTRNERNAIIQHGTMTMVRKDVLNRAGRWAEWCITEDAELGLRVFEHGFEALYVPRSYGQDLIPDTYLDFKKQRFRWAYGAVRILRAHLGEMTGLRPSSLSAGQRYHFLAGWMPWFADGFNLLFTFAALAWSIAMLGWPDHFDPPRVIFSLLPLLLFGFKLLKLVVLYRGRVRASWLQTLGAALAGLALAHTIARAMLTGMATAKLPFFRTPKQANSTALSRAFRDAREEVLMLIALWLGAGTVLFAKDTVENDVRMWSLMLFVQSLPYVASLVLALVSALPKLPAGRLGELPPLNDLVDEAAEAARKTA